MKYFEDLNYELILDQSTKQVFTLRTSMEGKDDAQQFIKQFGKFDDSNWIVGNRLNKGNNCRSVYFC